MLLRSQQCISKDEFFLPNIDMLVNATAGHLMFASIDSFSSYNQIKMNSYDAKDYFWSLMAVILFDLQNIDAHTNT